jgi:putative GTP pyrophosphokinase
MDCEQAAEEAVANFLSKELEFELFRDGIAGYFAKRGDLIPVVHTVKPRTKNADRLKNKIKRMWDAGDHVEGKDVFQRITDLAGVRVLHLYQEQFTVIHAAIMEKISSKDWFLVERPKAYTWDPESVQFFTGFDLDVQAKESFYTSIHYIIRPREDSDISCEIQVRTLFEEIWGEVDHSLNYPEKTENLACSEQIRVLAKLVAAGSRLVDAIFRTQGCSK